MKRQAPDVHYSQGMPCSSAASPALKLKWEHKEGYPGIGKGVPRQPDLCAEVLPKQSRIWDEGTLNGGKSIGEMFASSNPAPNEMMERFSGPDSFL